MKQTMLAFSEHLVLSSGPLPCQAECPIGYLVLTKNGLLSSDGTYAVIALISWAAGGALVDCQGCHGASLLPNTLKKFLTLLEDCCVTFFL